MTMYGADTEALDALAGRLSGGADQLETIAALLQYQVVRTQWGGDDDAVFQHDWRGRHLPNLLTTAEFLRHANIVVRQNAEQQRIASGILGPAVGLVVVGGTASGGWMDVVDGHWADTKEARMAVKLALSARSIYKGGRAISVLAGGTAAARTAANAGKAMGTFAKVGARLGVIGGFVSIGVGVSKLADPDATGTQLASGTLDVISGTLGAVAGVMALSGVGAPVAAVLGGVAAVIGVASMIVEHHQAIAEFATKAAAVAKQAAQQVAQQAARVARKAWKKFKFW